MRVEGQILKAWVLSALLMASSIAGAQSQTSSASQPTATAAAPVVPADARQLWQLIDYVAVDYAGAVDGGIAWTLLRTSARMPIGKFFSITSVLVVVLVGKGASALQEAGWLGASAFAGPRVDWLGLYPTLQTVAAQALVAAVALAGFAFNWVSSRRKMPCRSLRHHRNNGCHPR